MDDKTDKTDKADTTDKADKADRTLPYNDNTMAYDTVPDNRTGDNRTGDNTIQDRVVTVKAPARPKGPNASAIVVGLVAMVLAGLVIAKETMGLQVDWSRLGPGAIVGLGVVMLLIGAIGLVRRHDDV